MQIRDIDDPRLVKALAHPVRIEILRILQERRASPSEIAQQIEVRLANVNYHVKALERLGIIELVSTRPRRGATEHYYKARSRIRISDRVWEQVPEVVKGAMIDAAVGVAVKTLTAAAAADGFARKEAVSSRKILSLDDQGFRELSRAVNDLIALAQKIEDESIRRGRSSGEHAERQAGLVMALFDAASADDLIQTRANSPHGRPVKAKR